MSPRSATHVTAKGVTVPAHVLRAVPDQLHAAGVPDAHVPRVPPAVHPAEGRGAGAAEQHVGEGRDGGHGRRRHRALLDLPPGQPHGAVPSVPSGVLCRLCPGPCPGFWQ